MVFIRLYVEYCTINCRTKSDTNWASYNNIIQAYIFCTVPGQYMPYIVPHNSGRCTYGTFDPAGWPARGHRARSDILGRLLHFSAFYYYYYYYSTCNIFDSLVNYEYKRIYLPVMKMSVTCNSLVCKLRKVDCAW